LIRRRTRELREKKLDSDDLSLAEREFRVGYPERDMQREFPLVSKYLKIGITKNKMQLRFVHTPTGVN
jgi:hypothetical protein